MGSNLGFEAGRLSLRAIGLIFENAVGLDHEMSPSEADELLDLIYQGATIPDMWPAVLDSLAEMIGSERRCLLRAIRINGKRRLGGRKHSPFGLRLMSESGQKAKYSLRADVFRVAPDSGHCATQSAWRFVPKFPSRNGSTF